MNSKENLWSQLLEGIANGDVEHVGRYAEQLAQIEKKKRQEEKRLNLQDSPTRRKSTSEPECVTISSPRVIVMSSNEISPSRSPKLKEDQVINHSSSVEINGHSITEVSTSSWKSTLNLASNAFFDTIHKNITQKKDDFQKEKKEKREREKVIYVDCSSRIRSYKEGSIMWPHTKPTPEECAAAGFFFSPKTNRKDRCKCCSCGVTFFNWQPEDEPIKIHRKLKSNCCEIVVNLPFQDEKKVNTFGIDILKMIGIEKNKIKVSKVPNEEDGRGPNSFPENWQDFKTEDGIPFWYNILTNDICWRNPFPVQTINDSFSQSDFIEQLEDMLDINIPKEDTMSEIRLD